MEPELAHILRDLETHFRDRRVNLVETSIETDGGNGIHLKGRVLDEKTLSGLCELIRAAVPGVEIDAHEVKVLRNPSPKWMNVAVNLTGLYYEPSWLAEMGTQNIYGTLLEILEEKEDWAFVRQEDGYLGWMYLPYLSKTRLPQPNYRVCKPFAALREQPDLDAPLTGRLPEGVEVRVGDVFGNWLKVEGHPCDLPCRMQGGWVNHSYLMSLEDVPATIEAKRETIIDTAFDLYGVPYLWGGSTANGIDCSGLAQLCYRMAGVALPRDADMQRNVGVPVIGQPEAGDLIFFTEKGNHARISHVGISLGDGRVIHSSRMRNGVGVDEIKADQHLREDFAGAYRYLHNLN